MSGIDPKTELSIVIAAYNEGDGIAIVLEQPEAQNVTGVSLLI